MSQLACYNPEIDQRTDEVKMMRCPEECEKQQMPKQEKLGWKKQKEKEKKEKKEKRQEMKKQRKKEERKRKRRTIEVKKLVEEWKIWNEKEEVAKLEETKWLVPERFHKWIYVFGKKASKQ